MVKNACYDIMAAYPLSGFIPGLGFDNGIGALELVLACVYLLNASLMLFWIYQQRKKASQGVEGASMYVIFPVYMPFMWISVLADLLLSCVLLFTSHSNFHTGLSWGQSVALAFVYAFDHFVIEGIAFIMMQYGCGYQAASRSAVWALWWAVITFFAQLVVFKQGSDTTEAKLSQISWNVLQVAFYSALWLLPDRFLFRRPALIFFAKFWFIFRLLYFISELLVSFSAPGSWALAIGYCGDFSINCLVFALCKPFVIYYTLLSDSKWWQGVGQRKPLSMSSQNSAHGSDSTLLSVNSPPYGNGSKRADKIKYEQLGNPLIGIEVGFNEAQGLAEEVDNLRFHGSVKLLNFAYLSIEKKSSLLGQGSSSKVYSGRYKGEKVAIKMLFTVDLNPDVIKRYSKEAQILSEIKDENVVKIYGVSVLPPSVCIVLEKCQYGSLSDVIRGSVTGNTPPLKLTFIDRMWLALGCAKGLKALHDHSRFLCHRDIKSFNFLVDASLCVKLADLELGLDFNDIEEADNDDDQSKKIFVSQNAIMASWQSPESVQGKTYDQSCDIFSLSIVLWEIITTYVYFQTRFDIKDYAYDMAQDKDVFGKVGIPFSEFKKQAEIKREICSGGRPLIPDGMDPEYVNLITRGWDADPSIRPQISEVVTVLTHCWQQCVYRHLRETNHMVDLPVVKNMHNQQLLNKHSLRQVSESSSLQRTPSTLLLTALSTMQQESGFLTLESVGPILVVSAEDPYLILWATKKWVKLTGFVLHDILASSIAIFEGRDSNKTIMSQCLYSASKGDPRHLVTTHYRRDGTPFKNSLHIFPVFKKLPPAPKKLIANINNNCNNSSNNNGSSSIGNIGGTSRIIDNISAVEETTITTNHEIATSLAAANSSSDSKPRSYEHNMVFGSCVSHTSDLDTGTAAAASTTSTTVASAVVLSDTKNANVSQQEETSSLLEPNDSSEGFNASSPKPLSYVLLSGSANAISPSSSSGTKASSSPLFTSIFGINSSNNNNNNNNATSESNSGAPPGTTASSLFSKFKSFSSSTNHVNATPQTSNSNARTSTTPFTQDSAPREVCYIVLHFSDFQHHAKAE